MNSTSPVLAPASPSVPNRHLSLIGGIAACVLAACGPAQKAEVTPAAAKVVATSALPAPFSGFGFTGGGKCGMDVVNGSKDQAQTIEYPLKGGLAIDGWAFDDAASTVPAAIALQMAGPTGTFHAVAERNDKRPDLATIFGVAAYAGAGYGVRVDTSGMPAGTYDILLVMKGANTNIVCSTYRRVKLIA